jgi:hypothetical protein
MEKVKMYVRREIITPLAAMIVLTIYVISALRMAAPVKGGLLQESFFPLLIFLFGVPVAFSLLYEAVRNIQKETAAGQAAERKQFNVKPFLIALLTLFLAVGLEPLGFFITAPIYVFLFMLIYDDKLQQIPRKIIYTALIIAFVYVLYTVVFDIRFPLIPLFWS